MTHDACADRIVLSDIPSIPIRTFHAAWFALFLCFFAWFGLALLMPIVREELHLPRDHVGWRVMSYMAVTMLSRLIIGQVNDHVGPRKAYAALLIVRARSTMSTGLSHSFEKSLVCRMLMGIPGAGCLLMSEALSRPQALLTPGGIVTACSFLTLAPTSFTSEETMDAVPSWVTPVIA